MGCCSKKQNNQKMKDWGRENFKKQSTKKLIQKWLEKLAKANEDSFGSGPLDCCELNGTSKIKSPNDK